MLSLKTVQEVKRLLDEKCYSQRGIAEMLNVSRGTVQAIASGKRGIHGREPDAESEVDEPAPVRCAGCGARVYLPCVLCRARAFSKQRTVAKSLHLSGSQRVA